jgi:hypothetical protein
MSKYFTKYLPVEGEIQPHTPVKQPSGSVKKSGLPPDFIPAAIRNGWKPVKLFLCSTDIQVGDEVIHNKITSTPVTVGDIVKGFVWFQETPGKYTLKDCYKVIGEVSPDAVWVTEGMEFTEEQVEEWYWHLKQNCFALPVHFAEENSNKAPNFLPNTWENRKEVFKRGIFKFLCPTCKTFH